MEDYCAVCNRDTIHIPFADEVFEFALMCIECETVWEATDPNSDNEGDE